MIFDLLDNIASYESMNMDFKKAINFIKTTDLKSLNIGRYEIDGERIYAMISKEAGLKKEDSQLEIHRRYTDIQIVLSGTDNMGWKPLKRCLKPVSGFDKDEDTGFFNDDPELFIPVHPGYFVIFFPSDAHMPLIGDGELHKIVVKVAAYG
jgi:YhcH/YjgK/YiaL family protein